MLMHRSATSEFFLPRKTSIICRRRPAAAVIAYITSQQKCRGKKSRSSWVNPLDYEGIIVVNKPLILPAISWGGPWNLTNGSRKWRHIWSRRYVFQGPSFLVSMLNIGGVNPLDYILSSCPSWAVRVAMLSCYRTQSYLLLKLFTIGIPSCQEYLGLFPRRRVNKSPQIDIIIPWDLCMYVWYTLDLPPTQ